MKIGAIHTSRIGEQAGIVLFSQWDEFCGLRRSVLGQPDIDSIHDLRVVSRRMRATLALFLPFMPSGSAKAVSKEIKRVTCALGHLRNIDEAMAYVTARSIPLTVMADALGRSRKKEVRAVIRILEAFPCQEIDRMVRKAVAELAAGRSDSCFDQAFPVNLSETSVERYQVLCSLLPPAMIPENVKIRHKLRIAIKKWRYLLETVGQVYGQEYSSTLETLKEYQTILGNLNDMVEFGALVKSMKIPPEESHKINAALDKDAARFFSYFVEVAASRPLHYTFQL